jgi:AraC family transcriptional regulator
MLPSKTSGEKLHAFEAAGISILETRHRPGLRIPRHCHENAEISLVLGGRFEEVVDQCTYDCGPASALLRPAGAEHVNRYGTRGAHCLIVEFGPKFAKTFLEAARFLAHPICWREAPAGLLSFQIRREVCEPEPTSGLVVEGLVLQLLGQIERWKETSERSTLPPPWLTRARDFLNENYPTEIRLGDVALMAGVHAVYLNKSFKRYFGTTIGNYVRQLRLQGAVRLLTTSDLPISRIAVEVGFCDQSHLTNVFRRYMHCGPSSFRKSNKELTVSA